MFILKTLQEENVHNNCLMGLKVWWSWGSRKKIKIWAGRTVFRKSTPNLTITNGDVESNFEVLEKKIKKPLKVLSLARSVSKPLLIEPHCRPPPPDVKERSDWLRDRCLVSVVFLKRNSFQINLLWCRCLVFVAFSKKNSFKINFFDFLRCTCLVYVAFSKIISFKIKLFDFLWCTCLCP